MNRVLSCTFPLVCEMRKTMKIKYMKRNLTRILSLSASNSHVLGFVLPSVEYHRTTPFFEMEKSTCSSSPLPLSQSSSQLAARCLSQHQVHTSHLTNHILQTSIWRASLHRSTDTYTTVNRRPPISGRASRHCPRHHVARGRFCHLCFIADGRTVMQTRHHRQRH